MIDLTELPPDRMLYYVHIMHTRSELGKESKDHRGWIVPPDIQIFREWKQIKQTLETLPTPNKMYNDSVVKKWAKGAPEIILPCRVGFELLDILDRRTSCYPNPDYLVGLGPNDMALIDLSKRGCFLVRCEDRNLHCAQFKHLDDELFQVTAMFDRNEFIAKEIDKSLQSGEIGVLFLGRLHNLGNHMVRRLRAHGIVVEELNDSEYTKLSREEYLGDLKQKEC